MYLEKLEIQGFKSFAEPITLVFNRELTAIVGPNGSGKSNIADAIRWVLGEQSLKLLRGKKSEDVIFSGSDKKGRLGFARVAIHLTNENREAGIDYDNIIIERTINRTGESNYLINGARVRLSDIQLLLAKARVAQKSYSVIGQGMIDTLLTFSLQERKDFFDEATGVKQYQLKKHQALQKLEHTDQNLEQAELVLNELIPRLRALSRQVHRLERKEDLENQLSELHSNYYGCLSTTLNDQLKKVRSKKETMEAAVADYSRRQQDIQRQLDAHESDQGRNRSFNTLQTKLFNIQQEYNALSKKKIVFEGQQDLELIKKGAGDKVVLKTQLDDIHTKLLTLTSKEEELQHQGDTTRSAIAGFSKHVEEHRQAMQSLEHKLASGQEINWKNIDGEADAIRREHALLLAELDALQSPEGIAQFKETLKKFSEKLSRFLLSLQRRGESDYETLWNKFSDTSRELESLSTKLHDAKLKLGLNQQERALIAQQMQDLEREEKALVRELRDDAEIAQETMKNDLADLELELAEKETEMKSIRSEIESFNVSEEDKKRELLDLQKQFRTLQYDLTIKNNELTGLKVELAKLETRKEDLDKEISVEAPAITLREVRMPLNTTHAAEQIAMIKKQLNIIGGIDTETVQEYREVHDKHFFLKQQTTDLRKAQKSLVTLVEELDEHINKQFKASFNNINTLFSKYFKKLFNGGHAKLVLQMIEEMSSEETELEEPAEADEKEKTEARGQTDKKRVGTFDYTVEIHATPPGKKLSSITMLSGGEKALTSIALVCAVIASNPPPFAVLDEVDAALDEANSIRFAEIVSELTPKTQFITITHNRATMHQAKILYGVTMGEDGISRLLSVNFEEADKLSS